VNLDDAGCVPCNETHVEMDMYSCCNWHCSKPRHNSRLSAAGCTVVVCGPRENRQRHGIDWSHSLYMSERRLDEASERSEDVTEPATSRIISGTLFILRHIVPLSRRGCKAAELLKASRRLSHASAQALTEIHACMHAGSYP
jgi:hypothetical protein